MSRKSLSNWKIILFNVILDAVLTQKVKGAGHVWPVAPNFPKSQLKTS